MTAPAPERGGLAGFLPWRSAVREALFALLAGVVSLVVAIVAMRVTPQELGQRWTYGGADQILHYTIFGSAGDVFPYMANDRLGFPDAQNLFFAPLFDLWSALFATGLGRIVNDGVLLLNLYNLFTYFTVGVTGYLFFRVLRTRRWVSVLFAVIFAVVPFHFIQAAGHPFLASYWPVPLIGILILMVAGPGINPLEGWIASARSTAMRRARRWIPIGVLAIAVGLSQSYYFVFAAIIVGGVWVFVVLRSLVAGERKAALVWPTVTLASLYAVIGIQLAILSVNWGDRYAKYFSARLVGESELYGGKLTTLLFPWADSGLPLVGRVLRSYSARPFVAATGEGPWMATLPVVGIVLLMVWIFVRMLRARDSETTTPLRGLLSDPRVGVMAVAFLWTLFFYLTTGLGSVFAFFVSPEIRAWSRLGIVLTLFGLAFLAILINVLVKRSRVLIPLVIGLFVIALVDQTANVSTAVAIGATDDSSLRAFVADVEAELPDECGVVQLPLKGFPETSAVGLMGDYDEGLLPIYTTDDSLRYTYGAVRGTHSADFWTDVDTSREFEAAVSETGACAIVVDTFAYEGENAATVDWKTLVAGVADPADPAVESPDGRFLLFSATP